MYIIEPLLPRSCNSIMNVSLYLCFRIRTFAFFPFHPFSHNWFYLFPCIRRENLLLLIGIQKKKKKSVYLSWQIVLYPTDRDGRGIEMPMNMITCNINIVYYCKIDIYIQLCADECSTSFSVFYIYLSVFFLSG